MSAWLPPALAPVSLGAANYAGRRTDYGRLWWLFSIDATGSSANRQDVINSGIGNLNQWFFVIPRYDLVVVVTGRSNAAFGAPAAFLFSDILPGASVTARRGRSHCAIAFTVGYLIPNCSKYVGYFDGS